MAYQVSKTSALQTAIKGSIDIAIAELAAGLLDSHDGVMERQGELQDQFTAALYPMVEHDNNTNTGGSGSGSGGGGSRDSGFSVQEALDTVLNFGAFQGLTLGAVYHMTASEATAYSTSVGKSYVKAGQDWLRWAAANKDPKGRFIAPRAQAVLDNPPAP